MNLIGEKKDFLHGLYQFFSSLHTIQGIPFFISALEFVLEYIQDLLILSWSIGINDNVLSLFLAFPYSKGPEPLIICVIEFFLLSFCLVIFLSFKAGFSHKKEMLRMVFVVFYFIIPMLFTPVCVYSSTSIINSIKTGAVSDAIISLFSFSTAIFAVVSITLGIGISSADCNMPFKITAAFKPSAEMIRILLISAFGFSIPLFSINRTFVIFGCITEMILFILSVPKILSGFHAYMLVNYAGLSMCLSSIVCSLYVIFDPLNSGVFRFVLMFVIHVAMLIVSMFIFRSKNSLSERKNSFQNLYLRLLNRSKEDFRALVRSITNEDINIDQRIDLAKVLSHFPEFYPQFLSQMRILKQEKNLSWTQRYSMYTMKQMEIRVLPMYVLDKIKVLREKSTQISSSLQDFWVEWENKNCSLANSIEFINGIAYRTEQLKLKWKELVKMHPRNSFIAREFGMFLIGAIFEVLKCANAK